MRIALTFRPSWIASTTGGTSITLWTSLGTRSGSDEHLGGDWFGLVILDVEVELGV
jgi:hypothetical protein